jgi:Mg2+-importing ATPase
LGEGFNDAPALKLAHVGLAVENACDIARDAADVVLMNKSLSVIIDGIHEGRIIFVNTIKYIRLTLTSNFGNLYSLAFSTLFIPYLPMLPVQILLLNLLADFPLFTIATDTIDQYEVRKPRKYSITSVVHISVILGLVSTAFDFVFFAYFRGMGEHVLQTMWFEGSILTELVLLFSIRTMLPFWRATKPNALVTWFTVVVAFITLMLPFSPIGQSLFSFVSPTWFQLGMMLTIVLVYFITSEAAKLIAIHVRPSLKGK